MRDDMFRRRNNIRLTTRLSWFCDDVAAWWTRYWDVFTPFFMAAVGAVLLSATFIV